MPSFLGEAIALANGGSEWSSRNAELRNNTSFLSVGTSKLWGGQLLRSARRRPNRKRVQRAAAKAFIQRPKAFDSVNCGQCRIFVPNTHKQESRLGFHGLGRPTRLGRTYVAAFVSNSTAERRRLTVCL